MSNFKSRTNQIVKSDRVVINKQNVMEVGGNTAVESIEQVGVMKDRVVSPKTETLRKGHKYHVSITTENLSLYFRLKGKITNLRTSQTPSRYTDYGEPDTNDIFSGQTTGPFVYVEIFKELIPPAQPGYPTELIYDRYGSSAGFVGEFDIEASQDTLVGTDLEGVTITEYGFVPFFTEEQYQAILDLIG